MATIIVNDLVWERINEYYNHVETNYSNTWCIYDTISQINKIEGVINNFERICEWSREPIISNWKRNGWRETWNKECPWHFAFELNRIENRDYIIIQSAEHQDCIKECRKFKIQPNIQKASKVIRLTESEFNQIIVEEIMKIIKGIA